MISNAVEIETAEEASDMEKVEAIKDALKHFEVI